MELKRYIAVHDLEALGEDIVSEATKKLYASIRDEWDIEDVEDIQSITDIAMICVKASDPLLYLEERLNSAESQKNHLISNAYQALLCSIDPVYDYFRVPYNTLVGRILLYCYIHEESDSDESIAVAFFCLMCIIIIIVAVMVIYSV